MRGNQAVFTKPADGTGAGEQLVAPGSDALLPGSWSADGRILALSRAASDREILLVTPGDEPRVFEKDASGPAFSADGRFIAYASPAAGVTNVFVRSTSGDGKWQVSSEVGGYPRWSGDSRELFYIATATEKRSLMAVTVASGPSFRAGPPRVVVEDLSRYMTSTAPQVDWDVAPDGRRFVFVEVERAKDEGTRIDVALHWARHLGDAHPGEAAR
jgi:Tol biopolymer transport system component